MVRQRSSFIRGFHSYYEQLNAIFQGSGRQCRSAGLEGWVSNLNHTIKVFGLHYEFIYYIFIGILDDNQIFDHVFVLPEFVTLEEHFNWAAQQKLSFNANINLWNFIRAIVATTCLSLALIQSTNLRNRRESVQTLPKHCSNSSVVLWLEMSSPLGTKLSSILH